MEVILLSEQDQMEMGRSSCSAGGAVINKGKQSQNQTEDFLLHFLDANTEEIKIYILKSDLKAIQINI